MDQTPLIPAGEVLALFTDLGELVCGWLRHEPGEAQRLQLDARLHVLLVAEMLGSHFSSRGELLFGAVLANFLLGERCLLHEPLELFLVTADDQRIVTPVWHSYFSFLARFMNTGSGSAASMARQAPVRSAARLG